VDRKRVERSTKVFAKEQAKIDVFLNKGVRLENLLTFVACFYSLSYLECFKDPITSQIAAYWKAQIFLVAPNFQAYTLPLQRPSDRSCDREKKGHLCIDTLGNMAQ
jgi:hypothetical protein